jgi:hypothetical protein
MRARSFQSNFAMGILDEEAHGRVDLEIYVGAVADCQNAIPSRLGSLRRRAAFIDEGAPKHSDKAALLVAFRRSAGDQIQLELGDGYMRIWEPDGAQRLDGPTPYEIVTPWAEADLDGLRWDRSNDVVYFAHKSRALPPKALQRAGDLAWSVVALANRNGPWRRENGDLTKTISADKLTGSVTLTALGHAPFTAAMVGERIRLRTPDGQPSCSTWTPATDYEAWQLVQSDGKLYVAPGSNKKSGTAAPLHDSGSVSDGAMIWTYLCDGAAVALITGFTSPTSVSATIEGTLPGWTYSGDKTFCQTPSAIPFGPTSRWAFGAWSARYGWPGDVAVTDEERIAFSGPAAEAGRYDATRSFGYGPDYVDFTPGLGSGRVEDTDALQRAIKGGADPIEWLVATTGLMFGTGSREGIIQGETLDDALTPAGNRPRTLTLTGSSDVRPALAHNGVLFVPVGNRGLSYLGVGVDQTVADADLADFVEDLVADRIAGVVWAGNPDKVAWLWTFSGKLLSLTYQPKQNQFGWARHPLPGGFVVECVSVITDVDGRDVVWLIVRREKDGATQRRVWRQAARWRTGDPLDQIIYLDGCKLYSGPETATLDGLEHLAGETVRVFGNEGRDIFDAVVSEDGEITAPEHTLLTKACVGLLYHTEIQSLPLDQGGPGETAGALQRILSITIKLADSVSADVSFDGGAIEEEGGKPWVDNPAPGALVFKRKVGGTTTRDARWRVGTDDCWPMTVRSVRAEVTVDD